MVNLDPLYRYNLSTYEWLSLYTFLPLCEQVTYNDKYVTNTLDAVLTDITSRGFKLVSRASSRDIYVGYDLGVLIFYIHGKGTGTLYQDNVFSNGIVSGKEELVKEVRDCIYYDNIAIWKDVQGLEHRKEIQHE